MTRKLYETDGKQTDFSAEVLSCEKGKDGYLCILDQTAFFPEAGGQACDLGTLGEAKVSGVRISDGVISHLCDSPLPIGETVEGHVDRSRRRRLMEHHSGEHLVSGLIKTLFGFDNVGFHCSTDTVTLDTSGFLGDEQIALLEEAANAAVREDRPIRAFFPTPDEAEALPYRAKLDIREGLRLVEIEGYDLCACCAPHLSSTGEIGAILLTDHIRYKGGTRIWLSCGSDAVTLWRRTHEELLQIARHFSTKPEGAYAALRKAEEESAALRAQIKALRREKMEELVRSAGEKENPCLFAEGFSPKERLELCELLCNGRKGLCGVFSPNGEGFDAVIGCAEGGMRQRFAEINALLSGRGGGNDVSYQGKLLAEREKIEEFFRDLD